MYLQKENDKVKVLYFVDRMLRGGIQTLVIEWVKRFDSSNVSIDFLLLDDGNVYEMEDDLKKLGCNVFKLKGIWLKEPMDFLKYRKALDQFFKEHHDYKVVHMHSSSKNYCVLKYAKKYNIPVRIAHSHNIDFQTKSKIKKIIGDIFKIKVKQYATHYFACSMGAGKWMFGKRICKSDNFYIVHNAIDYEKFMFNNDIRIKIRNEQNFNKDDIVIGNVGRFVNQKNHAYLIDLFNNVLKINSNYKLLLIGTGELENEIKEKVHSYGIDDKVRFVGFKNNVEDYLNAMDIFVFPSLYEGLGIVLIEAQANGLKCLATNNKIPVEANATGRVNFIDLDNQSEWINQILTENTERVDVKEQLKETKYLVDDVVNFLETFYIRK